MGRCLAVGSDDGGRQQHQFLTQCLVVNQRLTLDESEFTTYGLLTHTRVFHLQVACGKFVEHIFALFVGSYTAIGRRDINSGIRTRRTVVEQNDSLKSLCHTWQRGKRYQQERN